ncbi:MAG: hypothetical protein MJ183_07410 [Treponemataceae bacterium]|nr:hypothetical protein [Treponemataceae bacterium]
MRLIDLIAAIAVGLMFISLLSMPLLMMNRDKRDLIDLREKIYEIREESLSYEPKSPS